MTKSTITREQLEEWVAQFDEDGGCDATDRQLEALIRQSLAAMDSEPAAPVAEVVSIYGDPEAFGEREIRPLVGIQQMPYGTKLYRHAQPAPVVPDKMTAIVKDEAEYVEGAAAPQSPGSEPATVPGKWISVSEQMPEVGDIVLTAMGGVVNVGETECSAANCRFFTSVISGRELPATHWMPLPASPQEVKSES